MKVGSGNQFQGSFGIPQHMKEAMENASKPAGEARPSMEEELPVEEIQEEEVSRMPMAEAEPEQEMKIPNPVDALREDFDVNLEDEDFHKIIFKGFLEKEVTVVPSIRGTKPMKAMFKTLTGEEYDVVDELLAEEIRDVRMTNEGYSTRRAMWILSLGITHIQGKPITQTQYKETGSGREIDLKATAKARRHVISKLNAAILTRFTRIHGQLTLAINAIFEDPEADFLKKP